MARVSSHETMRRKAVSVKVFGNLIVWREREIQEGVEELEVGWKQSCNKKIGNKVISEQGLRLLGSI